MHRKRKAAIINAYDPFTYKGGIETYISQLADLLKKSDVELDVYHAEMEDCLRHAFHNDYLGRLYLCGQKVQKCETLYDFIIANSFYGLGYFPSGVRAYNIFHLTHMEFAEMIKDVMPVAQYLEMKLLWGRLAESMSGFGRIKIAVSESVREELSKYYGLDEVNVIVNPVDTNLFKKIDKMDARRKWNIPQEAFIGLYVGRWDVFKGCDILEKVIGSTSDIQWIIVLGTGNYRHLMPPFDNVIVYEEVAHDQMNELYSAADFMLFPSRYEGFGYTIVEAMACELPVVTTNVGIAKSIYKHEPFRQLLLPDPSGDLSEIVSTALEKAKLLKDNLELQHQFALHGRRLVQQDYTIDNWEKEMRKVLSL